MNEYSINNDIEQIRELKAGTIIYINGEIFSIRDKALDKIKQNGFPDILKNSTLFHAAPTISNAKGYFSCGPTTASRMDKYLDWLFDNSVFTTIGKGERNIDIHIKHKRPYLLAFGGCGALYGMCIKKNEKVLYKELEVESINRMFIKKFPIIIGIDIYGNSIFKRSNLL